MGTFTFTKSVDDIEEPKLLEEDWYLGEIVQDPELAPNKKMQEDPNQDGAGHNLVIPVKLLEGEALGRRFTLYLGWPNLNDEKVYTSGGQKVSDRKMQNVVDFTEAFGGSVEGTDVQLVGGLRGYIYVNQGLDMSGQKIQNNVDIFAGFKSATFGGEEA